jgi:hypothetical protein
MENNKEIEVKNCFDCPFCYQAYNSEDMDSYFYCTLMTKEEYYGNSLVYHEEYDPYMFTEDCQYCIEYCDRLDSAEVEPEFDQTQCKCEEIRQAYIDSLPEVKFETPEACPLKKVDMLSIILKKQ